MSNGAFYPFSRAGSQIPGCPIARDVQILGKTTRFVSILQWNNKAGRPPRQKDTQNMRMNLGPCSGVRCHGEVHKFMLIFLGKYEYVTPKLNRMCYLTSIPVTNHTENKHNNAWLLLICNFSLEGASYPTLIFSYDATLLIYCKSIHTLVNMQGMNMWESSWVGDWVREWVK